MPVLTIVSASCGGGGESKLDCCASQVPGAERVDYDLALPARGVAARIPTPMNTLWLIPRFVLGLASPRRWGRVMRPLSLVLLLACGLWFGGTHAAQWWLVGRL